MWPQLQHLQSPHPWHQQHLQWHQAMTPVDLGIHASMLITPTKVDHHPFQHPLTSAQETLLARGPHFAIVPKYPQVILHHRSGGSLFQTPLREADELRSDISHILRNPNHNHKTNLTTQECRALTELKQDTSRVVLTTDKGVAMVIMDKEDYTNKAQALLQDTNTY